MFTILKAPFVKSIACAALCTTMSACSVNPIVNWQRQSPSVSAIDTMEVARIEAATLKEAIHKKVDEQIGMQVRLNDSLLGLGVFTIAAAVGKAHRDVYLAGGLLAGIASLYGTLNLNKPRLEIYQSGIGAVNCAVEAVRPLQVGATQLSDIKTASTALRIKIDPLARAISGAEIEFAAAASLDASLTKQIRDQIDAARKTQVDAINVLADADGLPGQVTNAASRLRGTLEAIGDQVNKLVSGTIVDQSAIPQMIAGLAGLAGSFAPGLGLEKLISARIEGWTKAEGRGEGPSPALSQGLQTALINLAAAKSGVDVESIPLASRLAPYKGHNSADALKACGVSDVALALKVDRDEVRFTDNADDMQSVTLDVSGGVKPYGARFRESPTRGVEALSPLQGNSNVEIRVPKTVKGPLELTLVISDSASPRRSKEVKVKIESATTQKDAAASGEAADAAAAKELEPIKAAMEALAKAKTSFGSAGGVNKYVVLASKINGDKLEVTLSCALGSPAKKDAQKSLREALVNQAVISKALAANPGAALTQRITPAGKDLVNCVT